MFKINPEASIFVLLFYFGLQQKKTHPGKVIWEEEDGVKDPTVRKAIKVAAAEVEKAEGRGQIRVRNKLITITSSKRPSFICLVQNYLLFNSIMSHFLIFMVEESIV